MSACPGCGLANYEGMCPVCRGDKDGYDRELAWAFGPWDRNRDAVDCGWDLTRDEVIGPVRDRGAS